jgi:plasmid replication initiation protein
VAQLSKLKNYGKVVQSNKLVEAHYRLNLQEKRFILWLISKINQDDTELKRYEISVKDFADMMGFNVDTQYKELEKVTEGLLTKVIKIKNEGVLEQLNWLCYARWEKGFCSVEFHPALKPYLLQLKEQFTQIGFADLLGLSSSYSVRLLELLAQYENIGNRTTTISDIRSWCGINEEEYKLYGHFKSRVINPAKKEINEKTGYTVDYTESKRSRKVDKIHWTIDKKAKPEAAKKTITEPKSIQREITMLPINYDSCTIPDIVYFCKANVNALARDKIDYLLRINSFTKTDDKLSLGFESPFFRDRCDIDEVKNKLMSFFTVTNLEFL